MFKQIGAIALVAIIGFSFAACSDGDDIDSSNRNWRISKLTLYTVANGVARSVYGEIKYNWIHYTSDTNYEYESTSTTRIYHYTRNGQTSVSTRKGTASEYPTTYTERTTYDSVSGLPLNQIKINKFTNTGVTNTTKISYTIQLLSDSGAVKIYKHYVNAYIENNVSQDVSTQPYYEYKIKNKKTLEEKYFRSDGVLNFTYTYTYPDDVGIRAILPDYMLRSSSSSTRNSYQKAQIISDPEKELVIRNREFVSHNNVLIQQYDITYKKIYY